MIQKQVKEGDIVYCLYVNIATTYTSFKIEKGKFLDSPKSLRKDCFAVEHADDTINYLRLDDIHKTEKAAYKALIKIITKRNEWLNCLDKMPKEKEVGI